MSARWLLLAFAAVCLVQWALPVGLIVQHERTLSGGTPYRFITAPVDPVDPFRGRYVALQFEVAQIDLAPGERVPDGARYAPIHLGPDGAARLGLPQTAPPTEGDWLEVALQWQDRERAWLKLPFDRYYLDERLAPEAERLYWDANRVRRDDDREDDDDPRRPTYAVVRVRGGHAVIEELFIDDLPVRERVRGAMGL